MNEQASSWGDILGQRNGRRFVGRKRLIERFRLNYLYPVPESMLFVLRGAPGMGKSALMSHYRGIAREHGMATASVGRWDIEVDSHLITMPAIGAMKALADRLAVSGIPLTTFSELYRDYLRTLERLVGDPDAPARALDLFGGVMDRDPWAAQSWESYLTREYPIRRLRLIHDPLATLTERFLQDLNAWATVRRIVLCFDDWQALGEDVDAWLLNVLTSGELSTNIWVMIAGQGSLRPEWEELSAITTAFDLEPLSTAERRAFLRHRQVESSEHADAIGDVATGNPLWMELLAGVPRRRFIDTAAHPLDVYLSALDAERRLALLQSTAARWIDEDVVRVLLGSEQGSSFFSWLIASPLVIRVGDAWRFRPAIQEHMTTAAQREIGVTWDSAQRRLYDFYKARVERWGSVPDYLDADWWRQSREALYHHLIVGDEVEATNAAMHSFLQGLREWHPWADQVVETWQEVAASVWSRHRVVGLSHRLAEFWSALLDEDWAAALERCHAMEEDELWFEEVRQALKTCRQLIEARLALPPEPESPSVVEEIETMEASQNNGRLMDDVVGAQEDERVGPALQAPQPKSTPPAVKAQAGSSAAAHTRQIRDSARDEAGEEVEKAREGVEIGVMVDTEESSPDEEPDASFASEAPASKVSRDTSASVELCLRGNDRLQQGAFEAAIRFYDEAIELNPDYVAAYYNRGVAHERIGALSYATADYTRVIELDPDNALAYRQRGLAYVRQGDPERAVADYTTALEHEPDHAAIYHDRANAYYRTNAYGRAIADYNEAIRRRPDYVEAYLNRGLAYMALGDAPRALKDYNQAIALDSGRAEVYNHRGQAYAQLERYDQALADFERALEVNPQYAVANNNRGLVYAKIEAQDKAIEAYQQAMAAEPDWGTPYYNAACVAALAGDVERACVWLGRAVALREAYRAMALRDPDFNPVRERACFKSLTEKGTSQES
ncbi:MAG: tetratricopeptide repeat protein [Anaerolineae bacterium]